MTRSTQAAPALDTPANATDPPARRFTLRRILRAISALSAAVAWYLVWQPPPQLDTPSTLLALWLGSGLLWMLAFLPAGRRSTFRPLTGAALLVIVVGLLPRILALADAPYNLTLDESGYPLYGIELLAQHPWDIVSTVHEGYLTRLGEALQAWPCLFLEPLLGGRVASVVLAIASLLITYALAVRLFNARVATAAVTLLACSHWHIVYSRTAYPYMEPMVFVPAAFYLLVRGVTERHHLLQFLGGVLLGACTLVYTPARVAIPVFIFWFAHRVLSRRLSIRDAAAAAATVAVGFGLFLTPYLRTNGMHGILDRFVGVAVAPQTPLQRIIQLGWTSAGGLAVLRAQLWAATSVYIRGGGWLAVDVMSPAPFLDPLSLLLALSGLCVAVARWRDSYWFLLLAWIGCTFVSGQVLTDVPYSAYRAAPLLPALAICGGWTAAAIAGRIGHWLQAGEQRTRSAMAMALLVMLLPPNLLALRTFLAGQDSNPWVAMARFVQRSSRNPIYYLVAGVGSANHPIFRLLGYGHTMRDMLDVMGSLGATIDPTRTATTMNWKGAHAKGSLATTVDATRAAVFVVDPALADAALAIRRCYPGAVLLHEPSGTLANPVLAFAVSPEQLAAGRNCAPPREGPGLHARYFEGPGWDGAVVMERFEDWPLRFSHPLDRYQSIEWSGFLHLPIAGDYQFQLQGRAVTAEAHVGDAITLASNAIGSATLEAGVYPISIRCRPEVADAFCWLRWRPPGGEFTLIPPQFLTPGAESFEAREGGQPGTTAPLVKP